MRVSSRLVVVIVGCVAAAGCVHASDNTPDTDPPVASVTLTTGHAQTIGTVLANGAGLVLYSTAHEAHAHVDCDRSCQAGWPLLTVTSASAVHLAKHSPLLASLVGTAKQAGGALVVTYGGYPLHTYSGDSAASAGNGQGIQGYAAVTVQGTLARAPSP